MPAELATPLSFERDAEEDPQVRVDAAEALYLLALQVSFLPSWDMCAGFLYVPDILQIRFSILKKCGYIIYFK